MKKILIATSVVGVGFCLLLSFSDSVFVNKLNSISNILLTIFTATYVLFTFWILDSTRQTSREQNRPYIVANLPLNGFEIVLSIKNIGKRPARNVGVSFEPSLDVLIDNFDRNNIWQPMASQSFMPPNYEVKNYIGSTVHAISLESAQKKFKVNITYYDSDNEKYSDSYDIDLNSYVYKQMVVSNTDSHYLKSIASSLEIMRKVSKPS